MNFKRVKTEHCDRYELYKQTYAPRQLYRSPRQLFHYRPPSKQSKKEISIFSNTFDLSLDRNIKKTPISHQPNIRDIFKFRPPLNQSQQVSHLISSKKHELLNNQKENSEICSNIKFQDSQFKQNTRLNNSQHQHDSRRSTQKSQYIEKTPKFIVIEPKIQENSNYEYEVPKDFGYEMEMISRKVNEAIRTNPYNFLEVIAKQSTEQKERQQRVNELMKMRMQQKQQVKTQSFEQELKVRDSLLGPEVIDSIKKITNDSIFKKSIKKYNKTFQTQSIFDQNASKDNFEDLINDLNQMTINESSRDQTQNSITANYSQIDSKAQTEPVKPKQKAKQRVSRRKRSLNGLKKKKVTKKPYTSFQTKQKATTQSQIQYCSKSIKQQKIRLNEIHTYESMSVVDKQIRGLHLEPLPKYNVSWNRLHQRQIARRQNPLFRTEEWRRITDLLPNFYPLNSEAYNCRIRLENPQQWKSRACLTLTIVSQACLGPVAIKGTIQVALAKKFSEQQQEEIKDRFFFDSNYSKSFLPGCLKDGMSLLIKNKFLVINGTNYDIPIRIIIETKNRNVKRR